MMYVEALNEAMSVENIKQVDIVNNTGLKKAHVSKIVAGSIEPGFAHLFAVVRYVIPFGYTSIMDEFSLQVTKRDSVISAFEYATYFNRVDLLTKLIDKFSDHKKKEYEEFASVYRLINSVMGADELIEQCRELYGKVKSEEMRVKLFAVESLLYYKSNDVNTMLRISEKLRGKIDKLNDSFFKDVLLSRVNAVYASGLLYNEGDTDAVREAIAQVLASPVSSEASIAASYHTLGHSYIFTDFDKALENLRYAASSYDRCGNYIMAREVLTNDIPFLKNLNNLSFDLEGVCAEERLHYYVNCGDVAKAKEALKQVQDTDCPYVKTYVAVLENDVPSLLKAHLSFVKRGNLFFARIVEKAVEKQQKIIETGIAK
ncbi:AimR family lysis-lysogeny pheromone receptor [Shouchella clausii]|uniref:AimR family lysis-lysogeny pheromone receptor n=1 Tax=Shouchella clausii TaxID=79880 RepID=UPI00226CED54|nr:AimR family lysis-lysogeny pheromone receptor [Shouchella clausii]MCY1105816.1 AimR family lysis-lysogeny pheromone receptor [Shouchella clausii]